METAPHEGCKDRHCRIQTCLNAPGLGVIPGLLTDGFGGPVLELASRRCGWSGRFTIATNLIWR